MKYISKLAVIIFVFSGCNYTQKHLSHIKRINSSVDINGWKVYQKINMGNEDYYHLKKMSGDTIFQLSFSYFRDSLNSAYHIDNYTKVYKDNGYFYQVALQNQDTLYSFRTNVDIRNEQTDLENMEFSTGKYFFMYKMGKLNWGQRQFFENNRDSLIRVKGNCLPMLKEFSSQGNDTFVLPEETAKPN